jgi:hypothetical protein
MHAVVCSACSMQHAACTRSTWRLHAVADYAPFNVDITTINLRQLNYNVSKYTRVAIGGDASG